MASMKKPAMAKLEATSVTGKYTKEQGNVSDTALERSVRRKGLYSGDMQELSKQPAGERSCWREGLRKASQTLK